MDPIIKAKNELKEKIYSSLFEMEKNNEKLYTSLTDTCSLLDYSNLKNGNIWTNSLQIALNEHSTVVIPASSEPYVIDSTVIIPSNRKIIAYGATLLLSEFSDVLMLRNAHPIDETHSHLKSEKMDENITILGGTIKESQFQRLGYGKSGKIDETRSFYGVSCCLLFNNIKNVTVKDVTFSNCAGFALQAGEIENGVFKNITFNECYADGLHFGGNSKNIYISDIKGNVGDDLVALNMYDWLDSSVTFGEGENIICENLSLSKEAKYKALRLEVGTYYYDDGEKVDCALRNVIVKNVSGIKTFKMYIQTPPYMLGTNPEKGDIGTIENIFFEDISIDLFAPIDTFKEYMEGDEIRGTCAAFELGCNLNGMHLKNIDLTLHDYLKESYLISIGPKSIIRNGKEIFDPYFSSKAKNITLENVKVNGEKITKADKYIKEISFSDVNSDGHSTGKGEIENIIVI